MRHLPRPTSFAAGFALFALAISVRAEVSTLETKAKAEREPITVTAMIEVPSLDIGISPSDGNDFKGMNLKPNVRNSYGAGVAYKGYSFSFALPVKQSSESIQRKGETNHLDFHFHRYWSDSGIDLAFADYQGFYVDGKDTAADESGVFEQRADVRARQLGLTYFKILQPENYHLQRNAEGVRTGFGHKGSWILMAGANHVRMSADKPLLTPGLMALDSYNQLHAGHFTSAVFGGGYGWESIFTDQHHMRMQLLLGFGPQYQTFETTAETFHRTVLSQKTALNLGYAFHFREWQMGFDLFYDQIKAALGSIDIETSTQAAVIFGRREF